MTDQELLKSLDLLKATMIAVATGEARIQNEETTFAELYDKVAEALRTRAIENPLPYRELWQWYGRWSSGDMPTWQSRRNYVAELFSPLIKAVQTGRNPEFEVTGWTRVDRTVTELRNRLALANTEEHYQAVGLLCRETLISTAQAVFLEEQHLTIDGVKASKTDAKRMLEAYIAHTLTGNANDFLRKHARAALDLAVHLQHKRTAEFRDAALCVEATTSLVNLIAIMAGRRDVKAKIADA